MLKLNELSKTTRTVIIGLSLSAVALGGLSFKKSSDSVEDDKAQSNNHVKEVNNSNVGIASGAGASVNFYQSADYKALQAQLEKAQQHTKSYPDDASFRVELKETQEKIDDFKRDVLKLAEDFNKIPINTERLRLAKQHFEAGDYQAARAILDAETMSHDQDALLDKKQRLDTQQAEVTKQLTDNATEFLLKARLTAIDYSLPDRIAQTSQFFEQALKSARTYENMFAYAKFLQDNNQFKAAERWYRDVLNIVRQLAKDNPAVYLPYVANVLNNLGGLVRLDTSRRTEAEDLHKEALVIRRQVAKDNPAVYLHDVAATLHNLAWLISDDTNRGSEAEQLYNEALAIRRQLAKDNPVYLSDVAMTLHNLGILIHNDTSRRAEEEDLYKEVLEIAYQQVETNPTVYLARIALTLNSLGNLVGLDSSRRAEAENLYKKALETWQQLAKDNPAVYLPALAATLDNLGVLVSTDNSRKAEAETLHKKALIINRQLAKDNPAVYLPLVAITLNDLGLLVSADASRRTEAETLYKEALVIYHQFDAVYLPHVAMILNNLGKLVSTDNSRRTEAKKLYKEALVIRRQLAKDNSAVHLPNVADTLCALGETYLHWQESQQALIYLQEAATILAPFAKQAPELFAAKHATILKLIEQAKQP